MLFVVNFPKLHLTALKVLPQTSCSPINRGIAFFLFQDPVNHKMLDFSCVDKWKAVSTLSGSQSNTSKVTVASLVPGYSFASGHFSVLMPA